MPARRPRNSAMLPALLVALGLAWVSAPGGARGDDAKTRPGAVKITLIQPKPGPDGRLTLINGAVIQGAIRIEGLDKERLPELVYFRFLRGDGAQAGDYVARPKLMNGGAAEYRVEIKAPPSPGQYRLKCGPVAFPASKKEGPDEAKYPGLDVTVVH